MNEIS